MTKSLSLHLSLSFKETFVYHFNINPVNPRPVILSLSVPFLVLSTSERTSCLCLSHTYPSPTDHGPMILTQLTTSVQVFLTASSLLGSSHCIWSCYPQPYPALTPWLGGVERFPLAGLSRAAGLLCVGRPQRSLSHTHTLHTAALPIQHFLLLSPACYFTDAFPSFVFVYLPHVMSLLFVSLSLSVFLSLFPLFIGFFFFFSFPLFLFLSLSLG